MNQCVPYAHPAWVEIDLAVLKANIEQIRRFTGQKRLCLPIKANGYGHGLVPVAKAAESVGVDYLAVSCLQEGVLLRKAGIRCPILVFGPVYQAQVMDFVEYQLELTISSLAKAKLVAAALPAGQRINIHVEIDTGMRRTGTRVDSTNVVFHFIDEQPCFHIKGIYSHLATADQPDDPFAHQQIAEFSAYIAKMRSKYPEAVIHLANSGGVMFYPDAHFDMVRPGKLVFGYLDNVQTLTQPVFSIKAKVAFFKVVRAGEGVSYGHTHTAAKDTRIVTVPVGYGDGYRRSLSNKSSVLINGVRCPIVGTICMDQFMVDIGQASAYVGDEVVLVGCQGGATIRLEEIATLCETIPSEILCNFNDRLPHYYRDGERHFWEFNSLNQTLDFV